MSTILDFGVRLVAALQGLGEWQVVPMEFFSFLGTEEFFMLGLPVIYWCLESRLGIRVAVILMFSGCLNHALKLAFHGPRPYWISPEIQAYATEISFGAPSGHAQNATAVWGIVAAYLRKGWAWLAAVLLILLIGLSRLSLGVHFPHDVLLGWAIGALLLWLTVRSWKPVTDWLRKQTPGQQVLIAFMASLLLVFVSLVPFSWLKGSGWQAPPAWAAYAAGAVNMEAVMTSAGAFFGLMAGLVFLAGQGGFETGGAWWRLVLRYLLGAAGVLMIRYGLGAIFPPGDDLLPLVLRYVRYTLIGAWVTGGAPWAFVRLKLAGKAAR